MKKRHWGVITVFLIALTFVLVGSKMDVASGFKSGLWDNVTISGVISDSLDTLRAFGLEETTNDDSIPYPLHIQIQAPLASTETGDTLDWDLADQSINKTYIDTTSANIPLDDAYRVTTAESDSLLATVYHAEHVAVDTLLASAAREIAGRFALALGLGTRDTFFITYGASSADTTFFLETGDSTLMWSNTPNPIRIGPSGAIQIATDGKVIFGVSAFHINTDADSTLPSIYWVRTEISDTLWAHLNDSIGVVRGNIGDTADVVRGNIPDSITAAVSRTISGEWTFSDGLIVSGGDSLVIVDATGADSALIYDTGDSTIFESDNPMRLGTSSIVIPVSGAVVITSASVTGGASLGDTVAVDTVVLGTKVKLVESAAGNAAFEHVDGTSPLLAVGNTTQTGASGLSIVDGGTDEPGYIALFNQNGSGRYLWVDDANILHYHTGSYGADPEGTGQKLQDADDGQLYNKGVAVPNNDVYVWAYLSGGDQALPPGAWTQVAFNAEEDDIGSDFNTTNNEFTAPDSGYYAVDTRCEIDDNGGADQQGYAQIAIYRNDSLKFRSPRLIGFEANTGTDYTDYNNGPHVSATVRCASGDQIQIYAFQSFDSGGGLIIDDSDKTWVTIRKQN